MALADKNPMEFTTKLTAFSKNMEVLKSDARWLHETYFARTLDTDVNALAAGAVLPGGNGLQKEMIQDAINAVENFQKYLYGDEPVLQAAFRFTFSKAAAF